MRDRNNALLRGDFSTASFLSIRIAQLADRAGALDIYNEPEDLHFIRQALLNYENYKKNIPVQDLASAGVYYEVIFDSIIPNSWNLDNDLVIVDASLVNPRKFEDLFLDIGQKKYIFLRSDLLLDNHISGICLDSRLVVEKIGPILPGRVAFYLDHSDEESIVFEREVREGIAGLKMMNNTIRHFEDVWLNNMIASVSFFEKSHCASALEKVFFEQRVLVISPGPSLVKCANALLENRSKFIFLAVAQAIPALVELNIVPDYVMVVDPQDYSHVLSGLDFSAVRGLIAYEAIHQNFFSAGFRRTFLISPPSSPIQNFKLLGGKSIELAGGSVSVQACSLAIALGASMVGLVGQDLCLQSGGRYASINSKKQGLPSERIIHNDLGELFLEYSSGSKRRIYPVAGRSGEILLAPEDYYMYRKQLEDLAKDSKKDYEVELFNFSEGGAQIDGFKNESLCEFKCNDNLVVDFIPEMRPDYLRELIRFVDFCINENENFRCKFENVNLRDLSHVEEFLRIPSIRCFGQRDLVDFFSVFDSSLTMDANEQNQKSLEMLMGNLLLTHLLFFQKLKEEILSFQR